MLVVKVSNDCKDTEVVRRSLYITYKIDIRLGIREYLPYPLLSFSEENLFTFFNRFRAFEQLNICYRVNILNEGAEGRILYLIKGDIGRGHPLYI